MITNLPIVYAEEVVLIPISKTSTTKENPLASHTIYYSNDLYTPHPIILEGQYNDYGIIENVKGDIEQFKQLVRSKSMVTEAEIVLKEEADTLIGSYLNYVERENVKDLGFILIHKGVFDKLKETTSEYGSKESSVDEIMRFIERLNSKDHEYSHYRSSDQFVLKEIDYTRQSLGDMVSLNISMMYLRKLWAPCSGAGSQCGIEDCHKDVNAFVTEYIKKTSENEEY